MKRITLIVGILLVCLALMPKPEAQVYSETSGFCPGGIWSFDFLCASIVSQTCSQRGLWGGNIIESSTVTPAPVGQGTDLMWVICEGTCTGTGQGWLGRPSTVSWSCYFPTSPPGTSNPDDEPDECPTDPDCVPK